MSVTTYSRDRRWTFRARSGRERTTRLELRWEVYCDPISDDWTPDEIDAATLWKRWADAYPKDNRAEERYGPGHVGVYWSIDGDGIAEAAPFSPWPWLDEDFLTFYSWPVDAETGEPVQFSRLPVADKLWRPGRADKGGFIQEATGWKPSALQPSVHRPTLAVAAGLPPG